MALVIASGCPVAKSDDGKSAKGLASSHPPVLIALL
jgi:hypothetical protein